MKPALALIIALIIALQLAPLAAQATDADAPGIRELARFPDARRGQDDRGGRGEARRCE